ncbi:MAG: hypothetical protein HY983_03480 [Candidatus Magasanikbacteria bacterium]|nr:hypothetical protein [Candidatus Magasanikbacteria bacterium]
MSLRTRLFIIISIVVLFVLGVSVFLVVSSKKKAVAPGTTDGQPGAPAGSDVIDNSNFDQSRLPGATPPAAPAPANLPIKPSTALEVEQNAAKQIAKIFVERYNTFSTDNNLQNIREVEELVTPTLWKKLSARLGSTTPAPFYMVITTQAFSTSIADWQDATAQVTIQTNKTTQKNGAITTARETITVTMTKLGNSWLVDSYSVAKP